MPKINLACIVGARPNFMKMAPLLRALAGEAYCDRVSITLIHTGQHYDPNLSDVFFNQLKMQRPDICLEVGSGLHGAQTAKVLERLESVLIDGPSDSEAFDRIVVVGDVNSTLAASIAAAKLGISIAHVEAGLRSFDRTMPEEINRIVTDSVADLLLVSEPTGVENLLREGHPKEHVHLVGNLMIDTLFHMLPQAKETGGPQQFGLASGEYGVVTLHRPSNVDDPKTLASLMEVLINVSERIPIVFPVHPRTTERLTQLGIFERMQATSGLYIEQPLGYLEFLALTSEARVIVTDSGGLQEESTALGIPCLTLRENTERPVTVSMGTSTLIGGDADKLNSCLEDILAGQYKSGECPELWDGHAAGRIAELLLSNITA